MRIRTNSAVFRNAETLIAVHALFGREQLLEIRLSDRSVRFSEFFGFVDARYPHVSPDGRLLFMGRQWHEDYERWCVYACTPAGSAPVLVASSKDELDDPQWSPPGDQVLVCAMYGDLFLVDIRGGSRRTICHGGYSGDFSPSGRQVVYCVQTPQQTIEVLDLDTRTRCRIGKGCSPVWSPDGGLIAFSIDNRPTGTVRLCLVRPDGTAMREVTPEDSCAYWARWAPSGDYVAFPMDGGLWLYYPAKDKLTMVVPAQRDTLWISDISHDSNQILAHDSGGGGAETDDSYIVDVRTGSVTELFSFRVAGDDIERLRLLARDFGVLEQVEKALIATTSR